MAFGTTRYTRRIAVQAASETAAGTAITDSSNFTSILTLTGAELQLESDNVSRDIYYSTFSPVAPRQAMKRFRFRIPCELRSAGAETAPEFSPLLIASGFERTLGLVVSCGATTANTSVSTSGFTLGEQIVNSTATNSVFGYFAGYHAARIGATETNLMYLYPGTATDATTIWTNTVSTSVTMLGKTSGATVVPNSATVAKSNVYKPISAPSSQYKGYPATIWWNKDGVKHVGYYCRGNMTMNLTANQIGSVEFDMTGLYATPSDVAFSALSYASQVPELIQNLTLSFGAEARADIIADTFTLDMGNNMLNRPNYNAQYGLQGIEITGRNPNANFNPDADLLANFDPFTMWENQSAQALKWQLGGSAGNRVALIAPATTVTNLTYADKNSLVGYNIPLSLNGTNGDDELFLMFY